MKADEENQQYPTMKDFKLLAELVDALIVSTAGWSGDEEYSRHNTAKNKIYKRKELLDNLQLLKVNATLLNDYGYSYERD